MRLAHLLAVGTLGVAGAAWAGPALEAALAWDDELELDLPAQPAPTPLGHRLPTPREGLETAPLGPGGDAPWLVPGGLPSRLAARMTSPTYQSGTLRWRAGFAWAEGAGSQWSLEGSMLALGFGSSELYASFERRHWGPGWMGSLILDGAASALPAVGWRRPAASAPATPWLRWVGPWSADVFVARLQGHSEPARPLLVGMRLQFEPVSGLEVGLSRTMQWGGAGRDQSLGSLLGALVGRDNVGSSGISNGNEPGNQLAGIDWRWSPDARHLPTFYGQVVGEDEAGLMPSRNMALLGADMPLSLLLGSMRLFVEVADTIAGDVGGTPFPGVAYRHHVYRQGYSHRGMPLGHPAGGDVRLASVGALLQRGALGAMAALSAGRALPSAQRFAGGPLRALNLAVHLDASPSDRLGAGLWWVSDSVGPRGEAQLWWQHRH